MIICHCNFISIEEIEETIVSFLDEDPWQLIVPLQVYHAMEKRGKCCGCLPNVVDIIVRVVRNYHETHQTPEADIICFVDRLREKHRAEAEARFAALRKKRSVA